MIIDAVCYPWHLEGVLPQKEGEPGYKVWSFMHQLIEGDMFRKERGDLAVSHKPLTVEGMIELMDNGGIDKAILHHQTHTIRDDKFTQDPKLVPKLVDQYPKRFLPGGIDLDPNDGMKAVRALEDAVKSYGYTSLYVSPIYSMYPWLPPSHALYYPLYAKCIDLDIAFFVLNRASISRVQGPTDYLHPRHLDQVAIHFPELRIVGRAFPWPWTEDMLALVWKHDNIWMSTSHLKPKYWPQSFITFMSSPKGKRRIMFSSGGPLRDYSSYLAEINERIGELPQEFKDNYFANNAMEAFKLNE